MKFLLVLTCVMQHSGGTDRQKDQHKFEPSLVYIVSPGQPQLQAWDFCLRQTSKQTNNTKAWNKALKTDLGKWANQDCDLSETGNRKGSHWFWDTESHRFYQQREFWQRKSQIIYNTSCCDINIVKTLRDHCWCKDSKTLQNSKLRMIPTYV